MYPVVEEFELPSLNLPTREFQDYYHRVNFLTASNTIPVLESSFQHRYTSRPRQIQIHSLNPVSDIGRSTSRHWQIHSVNRVSDIDRFTPFQFLKPVTDILVLSESGDVEGILLNPSRFGIRTRQDTLRTESRYF